MRSQRRDLLKAIGLTATTVGIAGCTSGSGSEETTSDAPATGTPGSGVDASADVAVAAEWNAMRARLYDAVALGRAGDSGTGAAVATDIFRDFERATGEYGAHERLESAGKTYYEGFESELEDLGSSLEHGEVDAAASHAARASTHLSSAQIDAVGRQTARAFDLLVVAARSADARMLSDAEAFEAAAAVAEATRSDFRGSPADDLATDAAGDARDRLVDALAGLSTAADNQNADAVRGKDELVRSTALDLAATVLGDEAVSGAGHLALLQARGLDATALAQLGGPSAAFAHAAVLNTYRARVADVPRLVAAGATDRAATVASDVFAHFEGARTHDALESASPEAYERFESGLESLRSAATDGDGGAVADAVETVDSALRTGIESLATGGQAAALEAGFFRARLADARELYRRDESRVAASTAQSLFERFERNELGFHETLEEASDSLYERFEADHLQALIAAFEDGDDEAVATHYEGAQSALLTFEREHVRLSVAAAAEAAAMLAKGFDASVRATLGEPDRADAIATATYEHFEKGAAGFHEALEHADEKTYESFESTLTAIGDSDDAYGPAKAFGQQAVAAIYAVVGSSGGDHSAAAVDLAGAVFETFEKATVHETLESADHDAYEAFETSLNALASAIESGEDISGATTAYQRAALRAQFAVVGAVENAPVGADESESSGESNLQGGPDVVEGVPEDADHVVSVEAVSFSPERISISAGDTVAFEHVGGEAHTVTAVGSDLPQGATYWASGGFDSEQAAREGWEEGSGAVQSGQSYVHTFETPGEHPFFCVPHEAAGMSGTVVVEP